MKKLFALVLCVLLIGALAVTAFAADQNELTVTFSKTEVKPGDIVDVTVSATSADQVTSLGFMFATSTAFEFVEDSGVVLVAATMNELSADGLALAYAKATAINGDVCTFQIKVLEDAPVGSFNVIAGVSAKNKSTVVTYGLNCPALSVACDHAYGDWTDNGDNHKQVCANCGDTKTAAHNWDAGKVTTPPDCKNEGVRTFTCADCAATKTEAVPSTGAHSYANGVKADDTNHTLTCTGCGNTKTEAHKLDAGKITTEPTCKDEGVKTFTCSACDFTKTEAVAATGEHTYGEWVKADDDNHKQVCTGCGDAKTEAHSFTDGVITKEPNCKEEGEMTFSCDVCNATTTEVLPTNDAHESDDWTLVDDDTHSGKCSICGNDVVAEHEFEPEFTEEKHWGVCACGAVTQESEHEMEWVYSDEEHAELCFCGYHTEIEKHTWDEGVVTVKPTASTTGVKTHTCTACGAAKETEIPKITTPATGDNNMNVAFVVLAVLATCGLAVTVIGKKRNAR